MDCERAAAEWADLPAELLEIISGVLRNPGEIVRFRSVCRSWRSSAPLPLNKLSPLFPRRGPYFGGGELYHDFNACAVLLVRPQSDLSKAWIVFVQEASAGKMVPRHALTYPEVKFDDGLELEGDWIVATQIVRFYAHNKLCVQCNGVRFTRNLVFASEISEESGCIQLVGLCSYPNKLHCAFRLDLGGSGGFEANQSIERHRKAVDYVKFNGRIFAVDEAGHIYVLDHTNLQMVQLLPHPWRQGNCIFYSAFPLSSCRCASCVRADTNSGHTLFHLGSQTFTKLWDLEGRSYLDLFSPPASFVVK